MLLWQASGVVIKPGNKALFKINHIKIERTETDTAPAIKNPCSILPTWCEVVENAHFACFDLADTFGDLAVNLLVGLHSGS
jgi:hypothetical protein